MSTMVAANALTLDTALAGTASGADAATPADTSPSAPANVFHYEQCRLANDRVALEPFDPSLHLGHSVRRFREHPELLAYMPFPPLDDEDAFVRDVWSYISASPAEALYAVRDRSAAAETAETVDGQESVAGFVTLSGTNPMNASTELGIILFPEFHHTHVSANAVGLMLQWLMDPVAGDGSVACPQDEGVAGVISPTLTSTSTTAKPPAGLGLRRVEWKTHSDNMSSRKLAERLGFQLEGICRWERIVQPGKPGLAADRLQRRNGSPIELHGQHMALYSIVWDEWDQKRPRVVAEMERGL